MGSLISRFRSKKSTIEILEALEKDIQNLVKFRRKNQELQKKFIGSLILYSIVLYVICAILFYFLYLPDTWKLRLLYSTPLLVFPFLVWGLKIFLHWYFVKRITKNDVALRELKEKKKQILEDVMENETYKKAKEILEKFDPERFRQLEKPPQTPKPVSPPGSQVRQRPVTSKLPTPPSSIIFNVPPKTPATGTPTIGPQPSNLQGTPQLGRQTPMQPRNIISNGRTVSPAYGQPPGPPLPRAILPRERSTTDKLLEYLVGDGPQNRYALICKYCSSHNGMALKEEFEYLSFRCCYCYTMNHARKQRPFAPKLEFPKPKMKSPLRKGGETEGEHGGVDGDDDDDDDEDDESGSDDDGELEGSGDGESDMEIDVSASTDSQKAQPAAGNVDSSSSSKVSAPTQKVQPGALKVAVPARNTQGVQQVKTEVQNVNIAGKDKGDIAAAKPREQSGDQKSSMEAENISSVQTSQEGKTTRVPGVNQTSTGSTDGT